MKEEITAACLVGGHAPPLVSSLYRLHGDQAATVHATFATLMLGKILLRHLALF